MLLPFFENHIYKDASATNRFTLSVDLGPGQSSLLFIYSGSLWILFSLTAWPINFTSFEALRTSSHFTFSRRQASLIALKTVIRFPKRSSRVLGCMKTSSNRESIWGVLSPPKLDPLIARKSRCLCRSDWNSKPRTDWKLRSSCCRLHEPPLANNRTQGRACWYIQLVGFYTIL